MEGCYCIVYCGVVASSCGVVEKMGGRVQSSGSSWNIGKSPRKLRGNLRLSSTPEVPPLGSLITLVERPKRYHTKADKQSYLLVVVVYNLFQLFSTLLMNR